MTQLASSTLRTTSCARAILIAVWLLAIGVGLGLLLRYSNTPALRALRRVSGRRTARSH